MMNKNTAITITYSDERLRILVEEYITMQKHEFTFKDLCTYVLYWAKEEGKTANKGLYETDLLDSKDCDRLSSILQKIVVEGRITVAPSDETKFIKTK